MGSKSGRGYALMNPHPKQTIEKVSQSFVATQY
jgi:hypothetical protein